MSNLFLLCGLSLLLYFKETFQRGRDYLRFAFNLAAEAFTLTILYYFIFYVLFNSKLWAESALPFFLPLTYLFYRILRQSLFVWTAVLSICLFVSAGANRWTDVIARSALLPVGVVLFCFLLKGVEKRLLFSWVPKQWQGLPILLLTAAVLAMIFGMWFSRTS